MATALSVLFVTLAAAVAARASDWPGWRGDGSGVATESAAPQSWSETEGIDWKTAVGDGHSSPIVWGDRVILTSASDSLVRRWGHSVASTVMVLVALMALWWLVDDLARRFASPRQDHRPPSLGQRTTATLLSLSLTSGAYILLQSRKGFTFAAVPTLALLLCLGTIAVFAIWFVISLSGLDRSTLKTADLLRRLQPPRGGILTGIQTWLALIAMAAFVVAVLVYPLTKEFDQLPRVIWPSTIKVCSLGLVAFFAALPLRSRWCLLAPVVTGLFLLVAFANVPEPGDWVSMLKKPIVWRTAAAVVLISVVFSWQSLRRRKGSERTAAERSGEAFGPTVFLLLVAIYFFTNNVMHLLAGVDLNVIAVDRETGKVLWVKKVGSRNLEKINFLNSAASPTPATDGTYIIAHFGETGTYALDFTGNVLWHHEEPVSSVEYGSASSPVLWNDLAMVTYDTDDRSFTLALDTETGAVRWRTERDIRTLLKSDLKSDAYTTPLLVDLGGRPQLISNSSQYLAGYDPSTGEEIWSMSLLHKRQPVVSPVAWQDLIVVVGGLPHEPRFMAALRLREEEGTLYPEIVWEVERNRPEISSPVAYDGYLYMVTRSGIATCLSLDTGEVVWKKRLPASDYHASVTAVAGKVYFSNADGQTIVIETGPEPNVLSINQIEGSLQASMAIAGGRVFLRTRGSLYSISGYEP